MVGFHYVVVLWGPAFTDRYLRLVLPNHLCEGNLGGLPNLEQSLYQVVTTAADAETIRSSPAWRRLSAMLPTDLITTEDMHGGTSRYDGMTACHRLAIATRRADTALIFLPPDSVWSAGTFAAALRWANAGKRLFVLPGIRTIAETMDPALGARIADPQAPVLSLPPRELMDLAMAHVHPLTERQLWESPRRTLGPSYLLFRAGPAALALRAFHLHPFMANPPGVAAMPPGTIDDAYMETLGQDPDWIHVVTDSDEALQIEMSAGGGSDLSADEPPSPLAVARFAVRSASPLHRRFVRVGLRLHGTADVDWQPAEDLAARVVTASERWLSVLDPADRLYRRARRVAGRVKRWLLRQTA